MKALVRYGNSADEMEIRDVEVPIPSDTQALIRVKAVGVCGTDVHMYHGEIETPVPITIGHEFCGIVESTGSKVTKVKKNDRVVSRLNVGVCGTCIPCLKGSPHMCKNRKTPGVVADGADAEYICMDESQLIVISEKIEDQYAAIVEPMAICAHALERCPVENEDTVVVFGPGPIGLIAAQMAKLAGASKVIIVGTDVDEKARIPAARKLKIDYIFNASKEDVIAKVLELTKGQGADLVIEASGAEPAINQAIDVVRRHGRLCVVGLPGKAKTSVKWSLAATKAISIIFSYSSSPYSWNIALSMLERGAFDAEPIVTHVLGVEQYQEMFEEISKGNVVKGVFIP